MENYEELTKKSLNIKKKDILELSYEQIYLIITAIMTI